MKKSEIKINQITVFLENYINSNGFPPTYREISAGVGLKSINSIKNYLDILEQRGIITKQQTKNRTIELVANSKLQTVEVPLVGRVAAGEPILAEENIDGSVAISEGFFGKEDNLFMLRVYGESMIEIGINNGDYVVAQKRNTAENGEIVVAMMDNSATVKTYYKEQHQIRLQPHNKAMQPIFSDKVEILGKVVGVIRKY